MQRPMMIGKIHRATVTQADLHYVGSITVDAHLLAAADLLPGQQVDVVDVTNGSRLTTYVIAGEPGSGQICINGAAAHLVHPGDLVILIAYGMLDDDEARTYQPHVVLVDADNRIMDTGHDPGTVPESWTAQSGLHPSGLPFDDGRSAVREEAGVADSGDGRVVDGDGARTAPVDDVPVTDGRHPETRR